MFKWIRSIEIKKARTYDWDNGKRIEVWYYGNSRQAKKPRLFRIGFSGSWAKPYTSMHWYFWRTDICFWINPFEKLMYWYKEARQDFYAWKDNSEDRCPECGSVKLRQCSGFAGEPIIYCKKCDNIVFESDPEPYIR